MPEDVSLIGFDGISLTRLTHPRPTTYCQDYEAIAREAMNLLTDGIDNPEKHIPRQITVPGRLLEGRPSEPCN